MTTLDRPLARLCPSCSDPLEGYGAVHPECLEDLEGTRRAELGSVPGYPRTAEGWVTFSRARIPGVGLVLVQKRDGCTRTVRAGR